ncbi:MAG: anthranilate phosphoribosyltransferase [Actinomycetota bacterium]
MVLNGIISGEVLPADSVRWAMTQVLSGDATPAQTAGFVMGLRVRGEDPTEVRALTDVMLEFANLVPRPDSLRVVLDVVGTGGDGSHSVNISTMSALVCAAAGAPVIKHGNRAASSQTGAADVLEALGVAITLSPEGVARCAEEVGIGFCFAPAHHPALRFAAPTRKELGVGTVFNILGPLTNPGLADASLAGCANERLAPLLAQVLHDRGVKAIVVRGTDGLDEISTCAPTRVWDATGDRVEEREIAPEDFDIARVPAELLRGGEAQRNAELLRKVIDPTADLNADRAAVAAIRDAVALNAAAALVAFDAACGGDTSHSLVERINAELERSRAALSSGQAWATLQRWAQFSSALSG